MLAAYTYVGKNTYISIEMANLEPEAEVTRQVYEEYKNGFMTEEAFQRFIEKQTLASESAIMIADELGKPLIVRNIGSTVEMQDLGEYYRAEIQNILRGQTVENNDLKLLNGESGWFRRHPRSRRKRLRDRRHSHDQADSAHPKRV
ncbi:MAG: hypothetical protein R2881_02335 [Eubacteriales bacterium]